MKENRLHNIFDKTDGHCHFCGNRLKFKNHGKKSGQLAGYWEVDHVFQRARGGRNSDDNCLPACAKCNRLRSDYEGKDLREILRLGQIVKKEMRQKSSPLGRAMHGFLIKQGKQNKKHSSK